MLMKSDTGMGTLITVFSGIAALKCLLVGLQLFFLETQTAQAVAPGATDAEYQFDQWRAQAHTGAIMSLGAGALILILGLRHLASTGQARNQRSPDEEPVLSQVDLDSVSVRVFEVDARDQTIEITQIALDVLVSRSRPCDRVAGNSNHVPVLRQQLAGKGFADAGACTGDNW